jgi:Glutamine cyclotransferase
MKAKIIPLIFVTLLWLAPPPLRAAPILPLSLKNSRPHDAAVYTQGLFFHGGHLYESAGLYGRSALSKWSFDPGRPPARLLRRDLPAKFFAEGAEAAKGEIYLLTWREQTGFVLDPDTLMIKRRFSYLGEGWGLAWDGQRLWRSDGSAHLYPHQAGDFAPAGEPLTVTDEGREIDRLNELEWDPHSGLMLANVYGEDLVAAIDLRDGQVRCWLDGRPLRALAQAAGLKNTGNPMDTVLNGLALDGTSLWLTGKYWPRLYQVDWPPADLSGKPE